MRKLTLGALILGVGFAASLPFRRSGPTQDASVTPTSSDAASQRSPLSRSNLEMLVQDVTDEVQTPVLYAPETRWPDPRYVKREIQMPLTYEDLAVPIDRGAGHLQRFDAMVSVREQAARAAEANAALKQQSMNAQTGPPTSGQPGPSSLSADDRQPAAGFAPANRSMPQLPPAETRSLGSRSQSQSVLAAAPFREANATSTRSGTAPGDRATASPRTSEFASPTVPESASANRPRHWIRQPAGDNDQVARH